MTPEPKRLTHINNYKCIAHSYIFTMYNDYTTELFSELWAPHITLGLEGSLRQAWLLLQVSSGLAVVFQCFIHHGAIWRSLDSSHALALYDFQPFPHWFFWNTLIYSTLCEFQIFAAPLVIGSIFKFWASSEWTGQFLQEFLLQWSGNSISTFLLSTPTLAEIATRSFNML